MKKSKTSLWCHTLGATLLTAGGLISVATTNTIPFLIGLGGCCLLFICGIESDLYTDEAQP